jgi:hypothetical protein
MLHVQLSNSPTVSALHKVGITFYFQYECNYSLKRLRMLSRKSQFSTTANEHLFHLKGVCNVKPNTAQSQKKIPEANVLPLNCGNCLH